MNQTLAYIMLISCLIVYVFFIFLSIYLFVLVIIDLIKHLNKRKNKRLNDLILIEITNCRGHTLKYVKRSNK